MNNYLNIEKTIKFLQAEGITDFVKNDLYEFIDDGSLSPYFHYSGGLIESYEVVGQEDLYDEDGYITQVYLKRAIKYSGYVSPADRTTANNLVKLTAPNHIRIFTINNVDPKKEALLWDEIYDSPLCRAESITLKTVYQIVGQNPTKETKAKGVDVSSDDCYFSKEQLKNFLIANPHFVSVQRQDKGNDKESKETIKDINGGDPIKEVMVCILKKQPDITSINMWNTLLQMAINKEAPFLNTRKIPNKDKTKKDSMELIYQTGAQSQCEESSIDQRNINRRINEYKKLI